MTMLEKVKKALRISHDYLNEDIEDTINTARAELIRSGVDKAIAEGDSDLTQMAIKTYCQFVYAEDQKLKDGYEKSWMYQLDALRKSTFDV